MSQVEILLGPDDPDDGTEARAVQMLTVGRSRRAIRKELGLSAVELNRILSRHAEAAVTPARRVQEIACALDRLDRMVEIYWPMVEAKDVDAGTLVQKIIARKCSVLGLDQTHRIDYHGLVQVVAPQLTTTQQHRALLDNVLGISARERELIDKHDLEGDDSLETLAEINALRAQRGKPPLDDDGAAERQRLAEEK